MIEHPFWSLIMSCSKLICTILLTGFASTSLAQESKRVRTVSVSGTALLEVVPDLAVLSIQVKNINDKTTALTEDHAKLVERAIATILAAGVKREDLSASNMAFGENRVYRNNSYVTEGFVATSDMTCKLRDLSKHVTLWKALAEVPGVSVSSVQHDLTQRMKYQEEARMKALETAIAKAERLAKASRCELGSPVSIREYAAPSVGRSGFGSFNNVQQASVAAGGGEQESAGRIPVRATIDIEYELIPIQK
jgi:uncharacterized protein YggE